MLLAGEDLEQQVASEIAALINSRMWNDKGYIGKEKHKYTETDLLDTVKRVVSLSKAGERKALGEQMKRTVIGEERSCPKGTEIWFLFKEEHEALLQGESPEGVK